MHGPGHVWDHVRKSCVRLFTLIAFASTASPISGAQAQSSWEQAVSLLEAELPNCTIGWKWGEQTSARVHEVTETEIILHHSYRRAYPSTDGSVFRGAFAGYIIHVPYTQMSSDVSTDLVEVNAETASRYGLANRTYFRLQCLESEACIRTYLASSVSSGWFSTLGEAAAALESDYSDMIRGGGHRRVEEGGRVVWSRFPASYRGVLRGGFHKDLDAYRFAEYELYSEDNYTIGCNDDALAKRLASALSGLIELGGGKARDALSE